MYDAQHDDNDAVIERLIDWADHNESVRAMLMTSTRAIPGANVDLLSDYDVILIVHDIYPFATAQGWIGDFSEVLVAYWDPIHLDSETGIERAGNVVQYVDGLKIDFSLWPTELLDRVVQCPALPLELDAGYRTLLDKDGLTASLQTPRYRGYIPEPPNEVAFLTTVNDFFIGVPYVAKCLVRDELLPAKWCLDYDMRYVYLLPMLEWRMECDHDWSISPGMNGKGLKGYLPPETWNELETTFAGADIEENWSSLFRMIALFRRVAREVADHLHYVYPDDLDRRVTNHAQHMRNAAHQ